MPRMPSAETTLIATRARLKQSQVECSRAMAQCEAYRVRATKAEQEVAEWKRRFDLLLTKAEKVDLAA